MTLKTLPSTRQGDILIVDDQPDNLLLLSSMLKMHGYQVRQAIDGNLALRTAFLQPPDIILLDIMMPGMGGYEVCQQLKQNPRTRDIPVIFLSSLTQSLDKVKAFEVGGVDYITKPIQIEEVLARIQHQLTIRALQTQLQQRNQELIEQNHQLQAEISIRQQTEAQLRRSEAQLQLSNQQLIQVINDLKRTQAQLVQSEKMSSLGQLVAGVAHEINNPVSFIYGNLDYASQYMQVLLTIVKLYIKHYQEPHPEILEEIQNCELDFLIEDFPKVLTSMKVGAERIKDIVLSMRYFSHYDQNKTKEADIHQGLDSTLMLLQNRLKTQKKRTAIEVKQDYGEIPLVECYPGELNQVFMNLLSNAIDALEEKLKVADATFQPTIKISTILIEKSQDFHFKSVEIRISDNGFGIPFHFQSRIFDPFFTTKTVGKGTGLGLSISYSIIVERHKGQLQCYSELGQGTELVIRLPINEPLLIPSFETASSPEDTM